MSNNNKDKKRIGGYISERNKTSSLYITIIQSELKFDYFFFFFEYSVLAFSSSFKKSGLVCR